MELMMKAQGVKPEVHPLVIYSFPASEQYYDCEGVHRDGVELRTGNMIVWPL